MKLKRIISGFLAVCMLFLMLPAVAFAEGGAGQDDHDSSEGNASNVDNWKGGSWRHSSGVYGYKVQLVMNSKGEMDINNSIGVKSNMYVASFISIHSPSGYDGMYVTKNTPTSFHGSLAQYLDTQSNMDIFKGFDLDHDKIIPPLWVSSLVPVNSLPQSLSSPFGSINWFLDATGKFAELVGDSYNGIGNKLAQEFKFQSRTQLTDTVFSIVTTGLSAGSVTSGFKHTGDPNLDLAIAAYYRLDSELKTVISSKLTEKKVVNIKAGSADATTLTNMILPISTECIVGWGTIVEPLHQLINEDNSPTTLPDEFANFVGSAQEWASLMGATQGSYEFLKSTYENMPATNPQQEIEKEKFYTEWSKVINSTNWQQWGEFASAHSAMEKYFPMAVYTSEGWYVTNPDPVPNGFHYPWQVTQGGSGIGMYKNMPVIAVADPCCCPASPTDDPCPCGGRVPCNCPDGCTCDPDNYTPGCDCVTPKPPVVTVPDPTIEEDHLSQQLNVPGLVSNNCGTDAWYVTFRPEYPGGEFRSDSVISEEQKTRKEKVYVGDVHPNHYITYQVYCPGCDLRVPDYDERDVPYTIYWVDNTYTKYHWVLDSFDYNLKIPLDRFVVYSYLKPTQELDLLKAVDGNPMFRLDGSYKNSHTFTYNKGDTTASVGDIFCDPQDVTWVSHRDELGVDSWFNIGLSWYMSQYGQNTAAENTLYKQIMSVNGVPSQKLNPGDTVNAGGSNLVLETNDGSQLKNAFDKTQGNFQFDFQIKGGDDSLRTPGSTKYDWVSDGTEFRPHEKGGGETRPDEDETFTEPNPSTANFSPWDSVVLNPSNFSQNVNVQGSYAGAQNGAPVVSGAQGPSVTVSGDGNTWTFVTPSDEFTFYPSYKMKAATSANGSEQDVWCLGHFPRTFQGYNKLTIQLNAAANDLDAVWSRDYGDSNTAKAGTAYKFTGGGGTIDITGHFLLMDPDFAPDPILQRSQNALILGAYQAQIEDIVTRITGNDVSVYSNLYWAGTSPRYQPKIASGFPGANSGRETIKILSKGASGSVGATTKTFLPGVNGAQTRSHYGATAGDPLGLNGILTQNFESGGGYTKAWYNEDFEGIITVTIKASIKVDPVTTDLALIEENLSDSRTAANALAQPVTVKTATGQAFTKASGQYAIGVELDLGSVSWGQAQADVVCMFNPITFNVRGNAYDMAD